jgi:hypothetical protein
MTVSLRHINETDLLDRSVWTGNCADEVFAGDCDMDEVARLADLWEDLPYDTHLHDKGRYRQRRYAKVVYDARSDELQITGETEFFQQKQYNPVNTGVRRFEPIATGFLESRLARRLIGHFAKRFSSELGTSRLEINLHQVRIIGRPDDPGLPTPEGIHKDGVDFSCQILFGRRNAHGGESLIYANDKTPMLGATMQDPLDFYCFRDRDIYHSVTPITPAQGSADATRDVLGMDFCISRPTSEANQEHA